MHRKSCKWAVILLAATTVCTQPASASETEYVTVNVFNEIYYGTLSQSDNSDNSETVFTALSDSDEQFTITGAWEEDSFTDACVITYDSGIIQSVTYKKGLISGEVTSYNPDGTYQTFFCTSGNPYGSILTFSTEGELIQQDSFYLCTPMETWRNAAVSVDYDTLISNPYDYIDSPVKIQGTIVSIYETDKQSFLKVLDAENHLYLFQYQNPNSYKYAQPNIANVSIGDEVVIVGTLITIHDVSDTLPMFYEHLSGHRASYSLLQSYIENHDFVNAIRNISYISDEDLENIYPEFGAVYCARSGENANPLHLQNTYEEICEYPFYYKNSDISLIGKIIYEITDSKEKTRKFLLQEKDTSEIYIISYKPKKASDTVLLNQSVSFTGTLNENAKLPYYDPENKTLGYMLYPNVSVSTLQIVAQ